MVFPPGRYQIQMNFNSSQKNLHIKKYAIILLPYEKQINQKLPDGSDGHLHNEGKL
jgi:hypothetical protein